MLEAEETTEFQWEGWIFGRVLELEVKIRPGPIEDSKQGYLVWVMDLKTHANVQLGLSMSRVEPSSNTYI